MSLSPVGEPYCPSLNACLALHDLPRVDLRLPREPSRELVVAKLELASAALYHLVPWKVGGDWSGGRGRPPRARSPPAPPAPRGQGNEGNEPGP